MKEISYQFEYNVSVQKVIEALTTGDEIKKWWTESAELKPVVGEVGTFKWINHSWVVKIKLEEISKEKVIWNCFESNMQDTDAWKGSKMIFDFSKGTDHSTKLSFNHSNYKGSPCYEECSEGWNFVLGISLKNYLESGHGQPYGS